MFVACQSISVVVIELWAVEAFLFFACCETVKLQHRAIQNVAMQYSAPCHTQALLKHFN
jgi:hypothetical protein